MTAWFPVDGGFTPGGMDNVMSGMNIFFRLNLQSRSLFHLLTYFSASFL